MEIGGLCVLEKGFAIIRQDEGVLEWHDQQAARHEGISHSVEVPSRGS